MTARAAALLPAGQAALPDGRGHARRTCWRRCARGVDMFDCIIPTKMAQQGYAYTFQGLVRITRQVYRLSRRAAGSDAATATCASATRRGYLQHLMRGKHHLGSRLLSIHNVRHYQVLTGRMREAILQGTYAQAYRELKEPSPRPRTSRTRGSRRAPSAVTLKEVG